MPLSIDTINDIAFITPATEPQINEYFISVVETGELYNILGDTLYSIYIDYPSYFDNISTILINPFIAYQVKYLSLIKLASELTEINTSLQTAIQEAKSLAQTFKTNLQNYLYSTYGVLPNSVVGFTIPQSIILKNEKDMTLLVQPTDIAPYAITSTEEETKSFTLPEILKKSSLVFVNNAIINPTEYTGIGTNILSFTIALEVYDKLVVTF